MMKRDLDEIEKSLKAKGWFYEVALDSRRTHLTFLTHFRDPFLPHRFHLHGEEGGPAVVDKYRATGVNIREEWRFATLNRENGPARIFRDRLTGNVVKEEWFIRGDHHRIGGPAVIKYDRVTGATTYEGFWENGKKLSERFYPENDTNPTPRMLAARGRQPAVRLSVPGAPG